MLQLEHMYKIRRSALRRILILNGVRLKTRKELRNSDNYLAGFKTRKYKVCTDEIQQDIVKMYLAFDSPEMIAEKYSVTPRVIRLHLRKHGVKMRTAAESAGSEQTILRKMCRPTYPMKDFEYRGIIFKNIQGWEDLGIKYAAEHLHINITDIIAGRSDRIPRIKYYFNNKHRYYLPDIYIPSINLLIEVKSTFTYRANIPKNLAKQAASKAAGYDHKIIIFNQSKSIHQII